MVLFTSGSLLTWGISRHSAWHLPQEFTHYLPLTIDFSCLYRDCMMTKYAFLPERQRGGEGYDVSMGSLNICHYLNSLELQCHSSGELLSISSLKSGGTSRNPAMTCPISWITQETPQRLGITAYPWFG